jgi:hypothetical protein
MRARYRNGAAKCLNGELGSFFGLVLALLFISTQAAVAAAYDFEQLEIRFLAGQDGWLSEPSLGEAVVRDDASAVNGTRVVQPDLGVASGFPGYFARQ